MMRLIPAVAALLACAAGASAQSVLERHVWEEGRSFDTISRTADMITGPIAIRGNLLVFDGRRSVRLSPVGPARGVWHHSDRNQPADVYRIGDPGKLRNGNTLCQHPARYVAFYESGGILPSLQAAFFDSAQPPKGIASQGLCGTFAYAID